MTVRQTIAEGLISCRNILSCGRTHENVLPTLQKILVGIHSIEISSTRNIVGHCTAEAINQIKNGNFISAGRILNLIHNLPLDQPSKQRWDIDYFLSIELPTFLEHFEEIISARQIILYVCEQIVCRNKR